MLRRYEELTASTCMCVFGPNRDTTLYTKEPRPPSQTSPTEGKTDPAPRQGGTKPRTSAVFLWDGTKSCAGLYCHATLNCLYL